MKNKTISPITKQVYINVKILLSNKFIQHSHPLLFILSHNSQNFKVIDKYKRASFTDALSHCLIRKCNCR